MRRISAAGQPQFKPIPGSDLTYAVNTSIHSIPPSSPVYNVSYVNVYGSTPETVTYGYTAGYAMGFITAGLLVYGTGYYYPPYVAAGTVPVYYPYPYSYAGNVWYNSATGTWARGGTVYYAGADGNVYRNTGSGWSHRHHLSTGPQKGAAHRGGNSWDGEVVTASLRSRAPSA